MFVTESPQGFNFEHIAFECNMSEIPWMLHELTKGNRALVELKLNKNNEETSKFNTPLTGLKKWSR